MLNFLDVLFQCRHKRCTFPLSSKPGQRRSGTAAVTGTYYVCLDCGKEFAYDWQAMEVVKPEASAIKVMKLVNGKLWRKAS
jgi:DNA-directed RNA polymerase subunit RPC12/RpoP